MELTPQSNILPVLHSNTGDVSLDRETWQLTVGRLIIQQLTFGPREAYSRPLTGAGDHLSVPAADLEPASSAFSRLSYQVQDVANEEEAIAVLGGGDGIVGVMFGRSVKEQLSSSWFWCVAVPDFRQLIAGRWSCSCVLTCEFCHKS